MQYLLWNWAKLRWLYFLPYFTFPTRWFQILTYCSVSVSLILWNLWLNILWEGWRLFSWWMEGHYLSQKTLLNKHYIRILGYIESLHCFYNFSINTKLLFIHYLYVRRESMIELIVYLFTDGCHSLYLPGYFNTNGWYKGKFNSDKY